MVPFMNGSALIAFVDLTNSRISYSDSSAYPGFYGGRGTGAKMLFDLEPIGCDALDPAAVLVFSAGGLVGTPAPCMSRTSLCGKNALNGGYASANVGGSLASRMRWSGIDHLVITGASPAPVWLELSDGKIVIHDASALWGMTTSQTYAALRARSRQLAVASIGPAGEKQCRLASVMVDGGNCAAWGGLGAVMGSKKVKAVVAFGKPVAFELSDPAAYEAKAAEMKKRIAKNPTAARLKKYGTLGNAGILPWTGNTPLAVRNSQDEYWEIEKGLQLRQIVFEERFRPRPIACTGCTIRCNRLYSLHEPLLGARLSVKGLQANAVRAFGPNLDNTDPLTVLRANAICNELGMNVDEAGAALAWAFECGERGTFGKQDSGDIALTWAASASIPLLLRDMGLRQGFGALLSDGVARAVQQVGGNSAEWAVLSKRTSLNEQGLRSFKGRTLGIMTSTRGGGHLNGAISLERRGSNPDMLEKFWGIRSIHRDQYEGKGKLVAWLDGFKAIVDSVGICHFATIWQELSLVNADDLADLVKFATGREVDSNTLLDEGARITNIEKAFNTIHAGFGRTDDMPPARLVDLAVSGGPYAGARLDRSGWELALTEYYHAHGWDDNTGMQVPGKLRDAGLDEVAARLESRDRGSPPNHVSHDALRSEAG